MLYLTLILKGKIMEKLNDSERTRCEVWTRVMGYHRPTSSFNIGKQGEFAERKYFKESKCKDKTC